MLGLWNLSKLEGLKLGNQAFKDAYHAMAKKFHPDRHPNLDEVQRQLLEEKFKKAGAAYGTLHIDEDNPKEVESRMALCRQHLVTSDERNTLGLMQSEADALFSNEEEYSNEINRGFKERQVRISELAAKIRGSVGKRKMTSAATHPTGSSGMNFLVASLLSIFSRRAGKAMGRSTTLHAATAGAGNQEERVAAVIQASAAGLLKQVPLEVPAGLTDQDARDFARKETAIRVLEIQVRVKEQHFREVQERKRLEHLARGEPFTPIPEHI